jgi:DNA-binding transcriptional LysR family regulator
MVEEADRDASRLSQGSAGQLRVVLECHTCFDCLMPVMDEFRRRWPKVEIDLVSGFHGAPAKLLRTSKADLVIGTQRLPAPIKLQDKSYVRDFVSVIREQCRRTLDEIQLLA